MRWVVIITVILVILVLPGLPVPGAEAVTFGAGRCVAPDLDDRTLIIGTWADPAGEVPGSSLDLIDLLTQAELVLPDAALSRLVVNVSTNGTDHTLTLAADVAWIDEEGRRVRNITAADLVAGIATFLAGDPSARQHELLEDAAGLARYTMVGPLSVTFSPGVPVPVGVLLDGIGLVTNNHSLGPYRIDASVSDSSGRSRLVASWEPGEEASWGLGTDAPRVIELIPFKSQASLTLAFDTRAIDMMAPPRTPAIESSALLQPGAAGWPSPTTWAITPGSGFPGSPGLLRAALEASRNRSLDPQAPRGEMTTDLFAPVILGFDVPTHPTVRTDRTLALAAWGAWGAEVVNGSMVRRDGSPIDGEDGSIGIGHDPSAPTWVADLADRVADDLRDLGIATSRTADGTGDLVIRSFTAIHLDPTASLDAIANASVLADPMVAAGLAELANTSTPGAAGSVFEDVYHRLLDLTGIVPLARAIYPVIGHQDVVRIPILGASPYQDRGLLGMEVTEAGGPDLEVLYEREVTLTSGSSATIAFTTHRCDDTPITTASFFPESDPAVILGGWEVSNGTVRVTLTSPTLDHAETSREVTLDAVILVDNTDSLPIRVVFTVVPPDAEVISVGVAAEKSTYTFEEAEAGIVVVVTVLGSRTGDLTGANVTWLNSRDLVLIRPGNLTETDGRSEFLFRANGTYLEDMDIGLAFHITYRDTRYDLDYDLMANGSLAVLAAADLLALDHGTTQLANGIQVSFRVEGLETQQAVPGARIEIRFEQPDIIRDPAGDLFTDGTGWARVDLITSLDQVNATVTVTRAGYGALIEQPLVLYNDVSPPTFPGRIFLVVFAAVVLGGGAVILTIRWWRDA